MSRNDDPIRLDLRSADGRCIELEASEYGTRICELGQRQLATAGPAPLPSTSLAAMP